MELLSKILQVNIKKVSLDINHCSVMPVSKCTVRGPCRKLSNSGLCTVMHDEDHNRLVSEKNIEFSSLS
jgi:hypothetical protein